jgi:hypothetical protein
MLQADEHTADILADADLAAAAQAVATMPAPEVPSDLAARTQARVIAKSAPFKRMFWLLRPITHPIARVAAAAMIIFGLAPLTDLETADVLGRRIEERIIGSKMTDRIEGMVDTLLVLNGTSAYSQHDLDAMMGVNTPVNRPKARKPRSNV